MRSSKFDGSHKGVCCQSAAAAAAAAAAAEAAAAASKTELTAAVACDASRKDCDDDIVDVTPENT